MSNGPYIGRRGLRCYEIDPSLKLLPQVEAILERAWFEARINPQTLYLSINNLRRICHENWGRYRISCGSLNPSIDRYADSLVHPVTGCSISLRPFGAGAWAVNTVVKLGEDEVPV